MNPKNINFDKCIQLAKKKNASKLGISLNYLISDLSRYQKYIKQLHSENPNLSNIELSQKLLDDFHYNLTPKVFEAGYSFENYMDLNSCKYLQAHSREFDEIFELVGKPDYKPPVSNESFRDYLETYIYYSIHCRYEEIIKYALSAFNGDMINIRAKHLRYNDDPDLTYKELEKYIKTNTSDRRIQAELINCIKIACFGGKHFLNIDQKQLENTLKRDLINSIVELTKTLDDIGAYERYETINERNLRTFQLADFQKNSSGINLYVSLSALPNYLSNLSIDDLMIMNTFWLNRYTKEISAYADCISVIKECDLLDIVLNSGTLPKDIISSDEFNYIIQKKSLLRPFITDYILKKKYETDGSIYTSDDKENAQEKSYITFSYEGTKKYVSDKEFSKNYRNYFSSIITKSENDPCDDIIFYANLFNPSIAAYSQKSDYLSALITNIETNSEIVNSGIIPTSYSHDRTHINLENFVGIGIDTKLTYPVREHISLTFLKDFVTSYTGSSIVPIYEGAKDFKDPFGSSNSFVSAQLVLPFTQKQLDLLKRKIKLDDYSPYNKAFIQHMYFLSNSKKIPDSFVKEDLPNNKKNKRIFQRKYVDLSSGQLYTLTKEGKYEEIKPISKKGIKKEKDYDR